MRRELNEIEYFNWCIGQPYNIVIAVRIRGYLQPDQLRLALDKAQLRHPLLTVNTEIGPNGLPWFSSEGVGSIPLVVIQNAEPEASRQQTQSELNALFSMNEPGAARSPLIRAAMLLPRDSEQLTELVLTAQHVIADGLSMIFLVRDLLHFIEEPQALVPVLDAPASSVDLLPNRVRRRLPKSTLRFTLVLWAAKLYVRLRFGRPAALPKQRTRQERSWTLTQDQTRRLRARCRREGVSVQSAICTAFTPGFRFIHVPVSVRSLLARPVGESVGLFVGGAEVKMKFRAARGFWRNARRFHRRLRNAMRDPFRVLRLVSKGVPPDKARQLGALLVALSTKERPFAVTNLGQLDASHIQLQGKTLKIDSFSGAATAIMDSSVLTVYTIEGSMRLHFLANEPGPHPTAIRDEADRAVNRLLEALDLFGG